MIGVLVVEDEPAMANAHATYTSRLSGFTVVAVAHSAHRALSVLRQQPVDLLLLDLQLPDRHGLEIVKAMRGAGVRTDVIAITAGRELELIRSAVAFGVLQYLLKPFTFRTFAQRLTAYRRYRDGLAAGSGCAEQYDVDQLLGALHTVPADRELPKGLSKESLGALVDHIRRSNAPVSAQELATSVNLSRTTVRRYLEHLVNKRVVERSYRHIGAVGRPEVEYRWIREACINHVGVPEYDSGSPMSD